MLDRPVTVGELAIGLLIVTFLSTLMSVGLAEFIDWLQERNRTEPFEDMSKKAYDEWMKGKK